MRPRNLYAARIPRVLHDLKAIMASPSGGRGGGVSGGVCDHGTHEEDGPGTWEALASPRPIPVLRRAGAWSPTHGMWRAHVSSALWGTEQAPASREATDEGNRRRGCRGQGVGGLQ